MTPLLFDHPYVLLAQFLTPGKSTERLAELRRAIIGGNIDWGGMLYKANLHFCTPLWFVHLRKEGFLPFIPNELQEYLELLYQANIERNDAFRLALRELLATFRDLGVRTLLLKGAATFCDDLYDDPGARMMGDLDILIDPHFAETARTALLRLGYEQQPSREKEDTSVFSGNRYHHLPRFDKPGTPVAVEIHTRVARRQDGRTLPESLAWEGSETATVDGLETGVLSPTHRLLHNTIHALLPQRNFIRSSVALAHLAEFASLAHRYPLSIDWDEWFRRGKGQRLDHEFAAYLVLGQKLMDVPWPDCVPRYPTTHVHLYRFLGAEKYLATGGGVPSSTKARIMAYAVGVLLKIFYHAKNPAWLWRNRYYAEGARHLPVRLAYTLRKLMKGDRKN